MIGKVFLAGAERLRNAPLGTKAPALMGGYWIKVELGWKWFCGDTFPTVGGDWDGNLIYPGPVTKCLRLPECDDNAPGQGPCPAGQRQRPDCLEVPYDAGQ